MEVVCSSDVTHWGCIKPVCNIHGKSHVVGYNVHRHIIISPYYLKYSSNFLIVIRTSLFNCLLTMLLFLLMFVCWIHTIKATRNQFIRPSHWEICNDALTGIMLNATWKQCNTVKIIQVLKMLIFLIDESRFILYFLAWLHLTSQLWLFTSLGISSRS